MEPRNFLIPYIQRCKLLYGRMIGRVGKQYGLSQTACDVLIFLHNNPQFETANEVVVHRMIAKSNVSKAVEELKQFGLLESAPNLQNRRQIRLLLTEKSRPIARDLVLAQNQFSTLVKGNTADEDWEIFRKLLEKTDENIQKALVDLEKGEI